MSSSDLVTVDNLEQTYFTYSDAPDGSASWEAYIPPSAPDVWGGELHRARAGGPSAVFTFTGSQVSVYGRIDPAASSADLPLSLYSVGATKLQAFIPDAGLAGTINKPVDGVAFFNSSVMPYSQYTLVINVTRASTAAPFYLDYIRYNTSNPESAPSSALTSVNGASTSTDEAATARVSSTSAGPIVGGVIGGVAVLAAAIVTILCYCMPRRRGYRRHPLSPSDTPSSSTSKITPYIVSPNTSSHLNSYSVVPSADHVTPPMGQLEGARSIGSSSDKACLSTTPSRGKRAAVLASSSGPTSGQSSIGDPSTSAGPADRDPSSHMAPMADVPNHTPREPVGGHAKRAPSRTRAFPDEPAGRPGAKRRGARGASAAATFGAQADSGLRFQPGLTPSNVAPVLPPGVAPIRSMATVSEVARADVPPAYTPI
ncbi:hypothetical protein BD413DRAFT_617493 [Trametes elegans]|nr:hypothetical protein BD413DRAFT_617493 [Trametes elegans]